MLDGKAIHVHMKPQPELVISNIFPDYQNMGRYAVTMQVSGSKHAFFQPAVQSQGEATGTQNLWLSYTASMLEIVSSFSAFHISIYHRFMIYPIIIEVHLQKFSALKTKLDKASTSGHDEHHWLEMLPTP